jgi:nitrogenase-stabilizing/protective protein
VVHVNRLHILKRFNQYLNRTPVTEDMDEATAWNTCKALLTRAYEDFVHSTASREKVFKVFQEGQSVSLEKMRMKLPSQRKI